MALAGFIMINIPLTAVGGKSAAAMATPAVLSGIPFVMANIEAKPNAKDINTYIKLGSRRDNISCVKVGSIKNDIKKVITIEKNRTVLIISKRLETLFNISLVRPNAEFIAKAYIGPSIGDKSIAPIITATLFINNPVKAIIPAMDVKANLFLSIFK